MVARKRREGGARVCACLSVSIIPVCFVARVCEHMRGARCAVCGVCGARGAVCEGGSDFVKFVLACRANPRICLFFVEKQIRLHGAGTMNYEL